MAMSASNALEQVAFFPTAAGAWKKGEKRVVDLPTIGMDKVLKFVDDPDAPDPNPLHRNPQLARTLFKNGGLALPDRLVVPGIQIGKYLNSIISKILGPVLFRGFR